MSLTRRLPRRDVLKGLVGSLLAVGAGWLHPRRLRAGSTASLREELDRLVTRDYAEQGIEMFLAGEDLAGGAETPVPPGFQATALNRELAGALRADAAQLQALRDDLGEDDVAALVERLAWREFGADGPGADA